jgi:hypothetical protein
MSETPLAIVSSTPSPPVHITPATHTPSPLTSDTPLSTPTATASLAAALPATETPSLTAGEPPSPTPTGPLGPTPLGSLTLTPETPILTPTPTPTLTPSSTSSLTPTHAVRLQAALPGSLLISEIAWAGTTASANDEWIELFNPASEALDVNGWLVTDGGDIHHHLDATLEAGSYFLLERTDDTTIAGLAADDIYTGALRNSGEVVWLEDPEGNIIDIANESGGAWPAGDAERHASMERAGAGDSWRTFTGCGGNGLDAHGNAIHGTPRQPGSLDCPTPTPTLAPTPWPEGAVWINEIAWAGTHASSSDEWIELHNPGLERVDLDGWVLTDEGDLRLTLSGSIEAGGFYLLERSDDRTVSDLAADVIYSGTLSNDGESLVLLDPSGSVIDQANASGHRWRHGDADRHASMERRGLTSWGTFTGYFGNGHDANGGTIRGTPRSVNSLSFPTPTPTSIPGRILINEVLMRPHYDWEGDGDTGYGDEFIELVNRGPGAVNLNGWILDDIVIGGSTPFSLTPAKLEPGEFIAYFRGRTKIALNDGGDNVRLRAPDGRTIDKITYLRVRAKNLSYGRLPDGSDHFAYGLWPTPGRANLLFVEPTPLAPSPPTEPPWWQLLDDLLRCPSPMHRLWALGVDECR